MFGVPFTEFDRVFFGLRYEKTEIDLTPFSPFRYVEYVEQFGARSDSLALTTGWSRDDRDNLLVPTRGRYQRAFTEVGLPGLDLQYYRLTYQFQQYFHSSPVSPRFQRRDWLRRRLQRRPVSVLQELLRRWHRQRARL